MPVRIVADTNIAFSGLLWLGPPRRPIELARERAIALGNWTAPSNGVDSGAQVVGLLLNPQSSIILGQRQRNGAA